VNTASLLQFLFSGLMVGAIYALVALGLNVVFNATGAVNFAQGEFSMLGGMLGTATLSATGLPLALVFACTVVAVTAIGVGMERLIVRPVRHADVLNLIIVTIGASILTVRDNLELGGYALPRGRDFASRLASGVEAAYDRFPVLRQRSGQLAGTLSGGEQQMLAIGRALMTRPGCCCATSRPSVSPRSSSGRSCGCSRPSGRRARRSCSSSRTRGWRCASRTAPTCWRSGAWPSRARRQICSRTINSRPPTSVDRR